MVPVHCIVVVVDLVYVLVGDWMIDDYRHHLTDVELYDLNAVTEVNDLRLRLHYFHWNHPFLRPFPIDAG